MTTSLRALGRPLRVGAMIGFATLALLAPASLAQTPVSETQAGEAPHPVHLHAGTCAELGEVVVPLMDVAAPDEAMLEGAATAQEVNLSQTNIDMPLQEIIDGGYAINVHKSAEEIDVYIACGDVGGAVIEDPSGRTELFFGLKELNDSGHYGVVRMGVGADANQTEVSVQLIEPDEMQ
ncbi:MAG: hypothetical protein M3Z20_21995 [Chloroflexota bacterium]|nr:hypothetical protein [Chloroflexota bacterium]